MISNEQYFKKLQTAAVEVKTAMKARGFDINFGGEGIKRNKIFVPTDARSEFLANRALGDWAEKSLATALRNLPSKWGIAHYGQSDSIAAGDEGFKEFYLKQLEQVRTHGKRPDLLVLPSDAEIKKHEGHDISILPLDSSDLFVNNALASIEVRSSKVEALRYMEVRRHDKELGKSTSSTRETPSFTVKTEDLVIVYRWIERYKIKQAYCQVFFDSVWGMNVLSIFEWIANNQFKIDNPDKSQGKATILIPITEGLRIGTFSKIPSQRVHPKVSRLGRHDSFIEPIFDEANLVLEEAALRSVIFYN